MSKALGKVQISQKALRIWTAVAERSGDTAFESFPISNLPIHSFGAH